MCRSSSLRGFWIAAIIVGSLLCMSLFTENTPADYNFDGFPLETVKKGTIRGGVFVDAGNKSGVDVTPYATHYDVPEGSIIWARLYVGVWGGTENYEGWVNVTFNECNLGNTTLGGKDDINENVYATGHGVYWVYYDNIKERMVPGGQNIATAYTTGTFGGTGNFDGRVYGIVLIFVYTNDALPQVTYWVNEGNENLNYKTEHNNGTAHFKGVVDTSDAINATLYTIYLCGGEDEPDYLYFNGYQLDGNDVADSSSGYAFDLDRFDVSGYLESSDNKADFWRGNDTDEDDIIGPDEGEAYLHPVNAILIVEHSNNTHLPTDPDLTVELSFDGKMSEWEDVRIDAIIRNLGETDANNFTVKFCDGDYVIETRTVSLGGGERREISTIWNATAGDHTIEVVVDSEHVIAESDETNNEMSKAVHINTREDLSVEIGVPVGKEKISHEIVIAGSIEGFWLLLFGIVGCLLLLPSRSSLQKRGKKLVPLLVILATLVIVCAVAIYWQTYNESQVPSASQSEEYSIPIALRNLGETKAENFTVYLYINGEKQRMMDIEEMGGNSQLDNNFSVSLEKGEHVLRVIVDEENVVLESNETNNVDEKILDVT